jgi:hypothetical protein
MTVADLRKLTMSDFEPCREQTFTVQAGPSELALKLIKVQPLGDSGRPGGAFSLWFTSDTGPLLPQAIYPLAHAGLGRLEIFLVPLGPRGGGVLYEAIFT